MRNGKNRAMEDLSDMRNDNVNTFIRTANERDLPIIQNLLRTCWHATYDGIYGVDQVRAITRDWHSLDKLKNNLDQPYSEFILSEGAKGIAGMAYAKQANPEFVMLHQLYVLPQYQGQGIGRELLAEIEAAFPDAKAIRLEVEAANFGAVRFYEKCGFTGDSETENCGELTSGIRALVMRKPLR
jgi:ribosomal protein S18 acetylase RimI-like enzyme